VPIVGSIKFHLFAPFPSGRFHEARTIVRWSDLYRSIALDQMGHLLLEMKKFYLEQSPQLLDALIDPEFVALIIEHDSQTPAAAFYKMKLLA